MRIKVLYFAQLKEKFGLGEDNVSVCKGCSVRELRRLMVRLRPELSDAMSGAAIAVNMEYADDSCQLQPGDVVALIPPVSGG